MARRRDASDDLHMVDVVLESDADADAEGPSRHLARGPARRLAAGVRAIAQGGGRHPRASALGLVLVLAAVGTAVVADEQQQADRRNRWSELGSVALPTDVPPRELWRVRTEGTSALLLDHGLYVATGTDDVVRALDADTGEQRWAAALPGAATQTTAPPCVAPETEPATVVCRVDAAGEASDLVVLAALDGQEVARHSLPSPPAVLVAAGAHVVLAVQAAGGGSDIRSIDPLSGQVLWDHHAPPQPAGPSNAAELGFVPRLFWRVTDGALFGIGEVDVAVELTSGQVLPWAQEITPGTANLDALLGGGWAIGPGIPTGEAGHVFEEDGSVRFTFDGSPLELPVDDRSEPGILLVRSWPELVALDARTGDVRWIVRGSCGEGNVVARLEGSLVCGLEQGGEGVLARIDVATGEEVWRRRLGPANGMSFATDGERILVLGAGDGRRELRSFAWSDGTPGWSSFPPEEVRILSVEDRRLYGSGDGLIIRLG